jgi:hypothetical protein
MATGGRESAPRPPAGAARPGALDDGQPVWALRHEDGTVSVLSALAPIPRRGAPRRDLSSAIPSAIARWFGARRRLYGGGVVFDEHGRALGYGDFDASMDECPRIEDMIPELSDLASLTRVFRPHARPLGSDGDADRAIRAREPGAARTRERVALGAGARTSRAPGSRARVARRHSEE